MSLVLQVNIKIKPENVNAFMPQVLENARAARAERIPARLFVKFPDHPRLDRPRKDRVDANPGADGLQCRRARQSQHRMLGGDITGQTSTAADRRG